MQFHTLDTTRPVLPTIETHKIHQKSNNTQCDKYDRTGKPQMPNRKQAARK